MHNNVFGRAVEKYKELNRNTGNGRHCFAHLVHKCKPGNSIKRPYQLHIQKAQSDNHLFTFIDTPGSHEYTSNALKGIGMADTTVLVFSAEINLDYQTEPSIYDLLRLKELALCAVAMGVKQIVVAFNVIFGISINLQ